MYTHITMHNVLLCMFSLSCMQKRVHVTATDWWFKKGLPSLLPWVWQALRSNDVWMNSLVLKPLNHYTSTSVLCAFIIKRVSVAIDTMAWLTLKA